MLAIGLVYSIPNLYPDDPAIQVSGASSALAIEQADVDRASKALQDAGIQVKAAKMPKPAPKPRRMSISLNQTPQSTPKSAPEGEELGSKEVNV